MALDIVSQFQDARCAVLLQKGLVDLHLELLETSAGRTLFSFLIEFIKKIKELLAQIEAKLRQNQHSIWKKIRSLVDLYNLHSTGSIKVSYLLCSTL